jgi:hypothetical protein
MITIESVGKNKVDDVRKDQSIGRTMKPLGYADGRTIEEKRLQKFPE